MSFTTMLTTFEKRRNSTIQAIFPQGTQYQGEIKGDFSTLELEMTFDFGDPINEPKQNYAYILPLKKYYFITGWAFVGGLWSCHLVEDVLATYQAEIQEHHAYVLRGSEDKSSDYIDTTYMQKGASSREYVELGPATFWGGSLNSGTVVCGIVGYSANNIGAVTYYAMNYTTFNNFMRTMLSSISWAAISSSEISEELQKALINPVQYIVSCHWLPVPLSSHTGLYTTTVNLGWWSFSLSSQAVCLTVPNAIINKNATLSMLRHPKYNQPGAGFVKFSPYSQYTLKFLPFGVFELDTAALAHSSNGVIYLSVSMTPLTGDAVLDVSIDDDSNRKHSLLTVQSNVGVPIPTGQISANLSNFDNALLLGGVAGAQDLIAALMKTQQPQGGTTVNEAGFSHHSGRF